MSRYAMLLALAVAISGCPRAAAILPGLWFFTVSASPGSVLAVELLADGTAMTLNASNPPAGATGVLGGIITWQQNRSRIAIRQKNGAFTFDYTGTVRSETQMDGTFSATFNTDTFNGTWSARFVATN